MQLEPQAQDELERADALRVLSEASAQYQKYIELSGIVDVFTEAQLQEPRRRDDWTHPIGLVMTKVR